MKASWDQALLLRETYKQVFARLRGRARDGGAVLSSSPVHEELSLAWTLAREDAVTAAIRSSIVKDDFNFGAHQLSQVVFDKARDIYIASWPDRVLLMAMASELVQRLDPLIGPNVHSFRKGHGVRDAAGGFAKFLRQNRRRNVYVLKRDVSKYGDSIPQDLLLARLRAETELGQNPIFDRLMARALRIEHFRKVAPEAKASLRLGIPSGSPLVPVLENFYLTPLDRELGAETNSFYGRYGDDFVFATTDATQASRVALVIDASLVRMGLHVKPEKRADLCLIGRDPLLPAAEGYRRTYGFDWLGLRVASGGRTGCKPAHYEAVRVEVRREVISLTVRAFKLKFSDEMRLAFLMKGFNELFQRDRQSAYRDYLSVNSNSLLLKDLDRNVAHWFVSAATMASGKSRRHAWQLYRRVRPQGLSREFRRAA